MPIVNFSDLRANLAKHLDQIEADRSELIVTRQNHEAMVVLSLSDFAGLKETIYLLGNPANAKRLCKSIASLEAGRGVRKSLKALAGA